MSRADHVLSRRQFAKLGALGAASLSSGSNGMSQQSANKLESEFLLDMQLDIADVQALVPRLVIPVTGGTFKGPRLKGVALDGGGDWLIRKPNGASEFNVRATHEDGRRPPNLCLVSWGDLHDGRRGTVLANNSRVRNGVREVRLAEPDHRRRCWTTGTRKDDI